jgi:UDP-glucose 4-epimerase
MRAVVTGGAGFIGSHVVDALVERGDRVFVLDDLSRGLRQRVHPDAALIELDVRDRAALDAAFAEVRPERCFHLAAQADVRVSVADPGLDAAVNVVGTANVLAAALPHACRVVFASTGGAIYGDVEPIPTDETILPQPEAPYGCAKFCGEQYLALYGRLHGASHAALRLGNVYGPRQDPRGEAGVVSIFCGVLQRGEVPRVFGDGLQTRDYVHVADVVSAFLCASQVAPAGVWNVGWGREVSVLDLLERLAGVSGRAVEPRHEPPRPGELQRSALDAALAERELGWRPRVELEAGLRTVWDWVAAGEPVRG